MFADDTKVWTRILTLKDGEVLQLQDDLNNLMSCQTNGNWDLIQKSVK